jgi:hypothetical protein
MLVYNSNLSKEIIYGSQSETFKCKAILKKGWFVLIIWMIAIPFLFIMISDLRGSGDDSSVDVTIESLALRENSLVGEYNALYRANTKYTNADGSYIILNIQNVEFKQEHTVNNGEILSDVVVISNATDIDQTRNFVNQAAYFRLFNSAGKEINIGDIYTQTGSEFSEIIFSARASTETSSIKYILIGGFDDSRSGNSKLSFEVKMRP